MTILTSAVVGGLATSTSPVFMTIAGVAVTDAACGSLVGSLAGMASSMGATFPTLTSIASTTGVGGAAGAMVSAMVGSPLTGGLFGAAASAAVKATAHAVGSIASTKSFDLSLAGPVGWLVLGASTAPESRASFDCWKAVVHEDSLEPSNGKLLCDIAEDPRVKNVSVSVENRSALPSIVLTNIWNERFGLDYVVLPSGTLSLHAVRLYNTTPLL